MFNFKEKSKALAQLETAQSNYEAAAKDVNAGSEKLFNLRKSSSEELIPSVEAYINTLANTPKEYDKTFVEFKAEYEVFQCILFELEAMAREATIKAGGASALGIAAGVSTAAFAPTAAMAIATTFGTASTGTAISTLSGAVATKTALAWLGGGALSAGGGGVAAGQALLALSGPIGWAIGGVTLLGGGLYARSKNIKVASEALDASKKLITQTAELNANYKEITRLISLTQDHAEGMKLLLRRCEMAAPHDYADFESSHKEWLGALVNHVHSLSQLLNKKIVIK